MDVSKYWSKLNLVKKVQKTEEGNENFWLLDGPPYPNAAAHMGHVRGVTIKDMLIKMKIMQGKNVWIKPGFDTHGLPIENKVEKELGIKNKEDIEKLGVSKFMKKCKDFATGNINSWMDFYKDLGIWFGWEKPYLTLQKEYMNSIWWSISTLFKKGLIKEGTKPFYWCPHCQTVLSGYEVTDEYKELEDPSVFVKFKTNKGFSLLAWTTTPWTLPGNTALVVRGDAIYVKVKVNDEVIVLAKKRLEVLDKFDIKFEIIEELKGKDLEGIEYSPVIDCSAQSSIKKSKTGRRVYLSKQVIKQKVSGKVLSKKEVKDETLVEHFTNLDEGTGVVHCAPGHGPADFDLGKEYNFEVLSPVNEVGRFTEKVEPFKGRRVRGANPDIVDYLKEKGTLLGFEKIRHRSPVCWRCKTPLIFRLTDQWILDISSIKDKMLSEAKKVEWRPEFARERMITWLSNAKDWTLSRQRYWNTPLPIWRCKNNHIKVIESSEELEKISGKEVNDLHRDVVDDIHFDCSECNEKMTRIEDVLDVWYDSGSASFAVPGYPKNKKFESIFPITYVDEGQDQIRGWFYTLMVLGVSLFDRAPYKKVTMHGWVVDTKGEKMSKSKGNFVTGREALKQLGSDILRFYILWESAPSDIIRFNPDRARKEIGKMFFIWKNISSYLMKFSGKNPIKSELRIEDNWILSKFNSMIKDFLKEIKEYNLHHATRKVFKFLVEDFSRKYMKLAKDRVRDGDQTPLWVLKQIHFDLLKLVAPISPFFSEEKYQEFKEKFGGKESIFFERYPSFDESKIDTKLEKIFDDAFSIVELILAYRNEKGIGLRYPIRCVSIKGLDISKVETLIKFLSNVKRIGDCKGDSINLNNIKIEIDSIQGESELKAGYFREMSRRIRSLRKKAGLEPHQKIKLYLWGDNILLNLIKDSKEFNTKIGALEIKFDEGGKIKQTWKIKGMDFGVGI